MGFDKKSFFVRALSGFVLLLVVLLSMLNMISYIGLVLVIAVGTLLEFYRMATIMNYKPMVKSGLFVTIFAVLSTVVVSLSLFRVELLLVIAGVLFFIFIKRLYRVEGSPFVDLGVTFLGIIYIAIPSSLMIWLAIGDMVTSVGLAGDGLTIWSITSAKVFHPGLILACMSMIWANDVFAYIAGVTLGRHRLFERISPKKSWEGFFGGLIAAILVGGLVSELMQDSLLKWVGLAVVVAISGVYGDLIESMFKRASGVKDSGSIIPGHGGFLDRFDALILAVPFAAIYFILFDFCT